MFTIAKYPDPILRYKAKTVSQFDDELKKFVEDMSVVMYQDDGIGLAAPQVSVSKRVVVIGQSDGKSYKAYINPEITFSSKDYGNTEEGCLSLPKIFGIVSRPKKIHLKYQDVEGNTHKEKFKGMEAVVLQHEIDHLNGILFIDRTSDITQGQEILDDLKNNVRV